MRSCSTCHFLFVYRWFRYLSPDPGTCPLILVSFENIASIYLLMYIIQNLVIAIGNNGIALLLELIEIIYDT